MCIAVAGFCHVQYVRSLGRDDAWWLVVLGLGLQLGRPVDVGLPLHGILVLQVQPGNLQVCFKLVVHAVLLLSCLKISWKFAVGKKSSFYSLTVF